MGIDIDTYRYMLLLCPSGKASKARQTSSTPTATCKKEQQMAPSQKTPIIRW
jgi:hypothetical protein